MPDLQETLDLISASWAIPHCNVVLVVPNDDKLLIRRSNGKRSALYSPRLASFAHSYEATVCNLILAPDQWKPLICGSRRN